MGFPSPANDYVEMRLTVDRLCHMENLPRRRLMPVPVINPAKRLSRLV